ncbi:Copper resistance protein CopD [Serinicoccus hydrothermalis]|uniref:Copper resistance protein CopD n=1 Tax=Serinicoccus hydrothermalis TaxID=1758689 RepID=A0A1B1NCL6_9MICO|nr:Copper resistance protein CopD [Serinicoccus hydrothermalis]
MLTAVLVAALLVGGGAPVPSPGGLPDAGPVTGWGLPASLAARLLAVLTVGQLVFAALLAPPSSAGTVRALRGTAWTAAVWLVAELAGLVLTASTILGVPVSQLSVAGVVGLALELPVGRATLWVAVPLVVVAAGSSVLARRPVAGLRTASSLLLVLALCAVVVPGVLAGHSAAAGSHVAAVITLSAHVVSATLWVGGLAALLL